MYRFFYVIFCIWMPNRQKMPLTNCWSHFKNTSFFFIQQPFQEHHSFSGVFLNLVNYICFKNIQSKNTTCFCFTSSQEHHNQSAMPEGGNKIFLDFCEREVEVHAKSITDVNGNMFKYHLNYHFTYDNFLWYFNLTCLNLDFTYETCIIW